MIIGIMSDIHDCFDMLERAVSFFNKENVDLVVNCGDWVSPSAPPYCKPLKADMVSVFGNNEGDTFNFMKKSGGWNIEFYNPVAKLDMEGREMVVYHGQSNIIVNALIDSQSYDCVFTGHTHVAKIEKKGKTLHINPGSVHPGNSVSTVALYNTDTGNAKIFEL